MRWDPKIIEQAGGTQEALKAIFELPDAELLQKYPKVHDLITAHQGRIEDGINHCLSQARTYRAIDTAYDVSQKQTSYTMMADILDKNPGPDELLKLVQESPLHMMLEPVDGVGLAAGLDRGTLKIKDKRYKVHLPVFFQIFVPMVMAYVKIRWAKLYNDRDMTPFYKYDPAVPTTEQDMICRVITKRIERMTTEMGLRGNERTSILHMLLYGQCINFPKESYYRNEQWHFVEEGGARTKKKKVVKEGVRFEIPHPSKTFFDRTESLPTINTDTGIRWMGYWDIWQFRDIISNDSYWNTGEVSISSPGWRTGPQFRVFNTLYPCRAAFPEALSNPTQAINDRKETAYRYSTAEPDAGVNVAIKFDLINPKALGLYDYDGEVWHRFIYAGDRTVIHCEPFFYTPGVAYVYDHDPNRAFNSSLALELLPFQDHIGNLLSQYILTVKKNLVRIVGVNTSVIDKGFMEKIQNSGENSLRGIEFYPIDMRLHEATGQSVVDLFKPLSLGQPQNSAELVGAINTIITVLERLLGFSPQEVGGSASHQQSATEVGIANANTTVRMRFTATAVDEAMHARKVLLLEALTAYGSDESMDQLLASMNDVDEASLNALEQAGFRIERGPNRSVGIYGTVSQMNVVGLASYRDGVQRVNDTQQGQTLLMFMERLFSNQQLLETAGIEWVVTTLNEAAVKLGIPLDLRLPTPQAQQQPGMQEQMAQIAQQVVAAVAPQMQESILQQVAEPMSQMQQQMADSQNEIAMIKQVLMQAAQQ